MKIAVIDGQVGANEAATGENAICYMASRVDLIVGSVAILISEGDSHRYRLDFG